jgi:predicted permease
MDALPADLRYASRRLLASPGFTAAALLTMTIGIGANSTIFTIVNGLMLRPLAVSEPERLVEVYTTGSDGLPATSSYADYLDYRDTPVFGGNAIAYEVTLLNDTSGGQSRVLFAEAASGNYWSVLGLQPALGRLFGPADDVPGAPPVAVVGYALWQRRFGGDPGIIGQTLVLNGRPVTVIGVAPDAYRGAFVGFVIDAWVPLQTDFAMGSVEDARRKQSRQTRSLFVRARLAPEASVEQANAALAVVSARLAQEFPDTNAQRRASALSTADVRLHPNVDPYVAPIAALLMAVPGLVLLIACANVANLLIARASGRTREIAVRLAVGASRWRLTRLLLTESTMLAVIGGCSGLLLAWALMRLAAGWQPPGLPVPIALDLRMDYRVLVFTAAVSALTGLLFGLAPALQATRASMVPALKDETATVALGRYRRVGLRNVLVVAQLAVSLVLLSAAGLFVRSFQYAQDIEPGFERERIAIFTPALVLTNRSEPERAAFTRALRDRLGTIPGVQSVALADRIPLGASVMTGDILVDDQQPDANGNGADVDLVTIGPGYFDAMRVPLVSGRDFAEQDDRSSPRVAIVSEAFAQRFWPGVNAIGRTIRFPTRPGETTESPRMTVIGIARDTKVRTLGEDHRPYLYMPWNQRGGDIGFVMRTIDDPASILNTVRREVLEMDPQLPILELKTMREHLSLMLTPPRLAAALLGVCGTVAILLASLGLYAVVAFAVARRTKEIGIRVALGATRAQVARLVVSEGLALVGTGVAIGLLLALAVTRPLGGYLYGLEGFDPLTFASVAALLGGTALVANYLPARRAMQVDPLRAIRYE